MMETSSGNFKKVQFPGLVLKAIDATTLVGATGIEIGDKKALFIHNSRRSEQPKDMPLSTVLAVFNATTDGRITRFKKFSLESDEGVSEIKLLHLQSTAGGLWPLLQIQYMAYYPVAGRQLQVEWQSLFDPNIEKFISHLPAAIVTRSPAGEEDLEMLTVWRVDALRISITDDTIAKTVRYQCGDPRVVKGSALVTLWAP